MRVPERFLSNVRTSGLLPEGTRVLAACSGGADSTALVRLLVRLRRPLGLAAIVVGHLDHGLREGSPDDARFVADLAASLGVGAVVERRPVRRRRGESPEEAARRVRYAFLADAARRTGCGVVATAHHMDDQAETVLYRVLRGAGLDGLRGIAPATEIEGVRVVRPLLPFRRDELRAWLRSVRQPWREDPTNEDGNDRARLRNEVLPLVREILRRDPAAPLARLAEAAQRGFARRPAEREPAAPRRRPQAAAIDAPPAVTWDLRPLSTGVLLDRIRSRPGTMEVLDADAVRGALAVRAPRRGDVFHPLGRPAPQRLAHYLQRRGVPASARSAVTLVCDDDGIVCVAGHGIAARAAVTPATTRSIVVRIERGRPGGGPPGPGSLAS